MFSTRSTSKALRFVVNNLVTFEQALGPVVLVADVTLMACTGAFVLLQCELSFECLVTFFARQSLSAVSPLFMHPQSFPGLEIHVTGDALVHHGFNRTSPLEKLQLTE